MEYVLPAGIEPGAEGSTFKTVAGEAKWVPGGTNVQAINAQTGTAYTLALTDAENVVTMSNAAASTLTVPPNSAVAFPVGTFIEVHQLGAGQVTIAAGTGVTITASPGLKIAGRYGVAGLRKIGTDTWQAFGRLAA